MPRQIKTVVNEALLVLKDLDLPKEQQNDRSALCLLALLNLTRDKQWSELEDPLMGITPIMDWIKKYYKVVYAPNTRETIRRQTMHQFVQAGIAVINPDEAARPVNSPHTVYQISPEVLQLLKQYKTKAWLASLVEYKENQASLAEKYAKIREQEMIPVTTPLGEIVRLTPGEHSELIKNIIEVFGPRFASGSQLLYAGDTGSKLGIFENAALKKLGVTVDEHGKMPDVILYDTERNWLFLIEAVTSHGPVDAKRHVELEQLFTGVEAGLVYVTAFPNRTTMARYLADIAWETEVWVADAPSHLIHFDGDRFLGPYGKE